MHALSSQERTDLDAWARILRNDPCAYCGAPTEHLDHIVPVAEGGEQRWTNLTAACARCNRAKHADSLLMFLLKARLRGGDAQWSQAAS
jgi:5-methylcytosine-specific restriction endonuclease McrA